MTPVLYLASHSPRRRELLGQLGVAHRTLPVAVDETRRPGEAPAEYVIRLALSKATAGWRTTRAQSRLPVLAADTAVVLDQEVFGKPGNREQFMGMMCRLSGRTHKVLTGVALIHAEAESRLSVSRVRFRGIDAREAEAYWNSGEPADKAGGYAIQGLGAIFVSHLEGSFSGVMGLPLFETAELLHHAGIKPLAREPAEVDE